MTRSPVRMAVTLLVASSAIGLAACSGSDGTASSTAPSAVAQTSTSPSAAAEPEPSLTPVASPVLDAVTATRALGTAAVSVKNASSVGRVGEWVSVGTGQLDLGKGLGRIAYESSHGGTSELLVNQDGAFVSSDGGTHWFLLSFGQTTPLLGSVNVFRALDQVDWSTGTPDTVDGVALTRYDGVMVDPTIADALDGMGVSTEQPELLAELAALEIDASVWIDADGHIVRLLRTVSGTTPDGPLTATQLATLTDFRSAIDIDSPPDDRVEPAPES